MAKFLRPAGSKILLASPSDCVFKSLLCINKSKIALSFVDDAKLELKFNPKKKQNQ